MSTVPEFMPVLSSGAHTDPREGACVMEYVSLLAGEKFTDHPACTMPALTELAIQINDSLKNRERHILVPLIPRLIGTATTDARISVAVNGYIVKRIIQRLWDLDAFSPEDSANLCRVWDQLDDYWSERLGFSSWQERWRWVAELLTATATAAAAIATTTTATAAVVAAVVAATATAAAAVVAATTTATAAAAAAVVAAVVAAAAAVAAAVVAAAVAATAAAVTAVAAAAADWFAGKEWMLDVLRGALDRYDEVARRVVSDLEVEDWTALACKVGAA